MFQRFVGDYAPFWCRNHCSLLLPLCVRNLLLRNHKRPSPRLDTGVGHCHQAALSRSCGTSFACMVFRIIWHLRWLPLLLFPFLSVDFLRNLDYSYIYKKIGWSFWGSSRLLIILNVMPCVWAIAFVQGISRST